jgi:ABC-type phosphate transport system permease subunit
VEAVHSGHFSHPGRLEVALTRVQVDGNWIEVSTSDTSRRGGSHRNNNLGWIGGGGVGGALIGGLAAGGKGALIGGPIGVGAGTAVAFFTGKKNVHLPAETELRFYTSRPVPVTS